MLPSRRSGAALLAVLALVAAPAFAGCIEDETAAAPPKQSTAALPSAAELMLRANGTFPTPDGDEVLLKWRNPAKNATVLVEANLTKGHLYLRVRDSNGFVILEEPVDGAQPLRTRAGPGRPGTWTIELLPTAAEGSYRLELVPKR